MPTDADTARFAQLYDRHAAELLRYCFRRTADMALAEDLVSVVFLEAWRNRARLQGDDAARGWLYGIATNVVRQQRRTLRRHGAALRRIAAAVPDAPPADEVLAREEEMRAVLAAVARLPGRERDVLALCVWSGLAYEDAALALGVPVGTVRSRLSRARARLRAHPALAPTAEGNLP
jgi:RNA polymerase sigma factor (sigma-70 family)